MYIAIKDFTVYADRPGLKVRKKYKEGDRISNWRFFWMKGRYKRFFAKPETFYLSSPHPEEMYRQEMQERDCDTDWVPHDDHMVHFPSSRGRSYSGPASAIGFEEVSQMEEMIVEEEIIDDDELIEQDIIIMDTPPLDWSAAITPDPIEETTAYDDPMTLLGPDPMIDQNLPEPEPIQESNSYDDSSYDNSSDSTSYDSDSSYDNGSDSSSDSGSSDSGSGGDW